MGKSYCDIDNANSSSNSSIYDVSNPGRRQFLSGLLASSFFALLRTSAPGMAGFLSQGCVAEALDNLLPGFEPVVTSLADRVIVPEGYSWKVLNAWGQPVGIPGYLPAFKSDASNSAIEQSVQFGMHHDGMRYFPINGSTHGLLVINHEYTDDGLLHKTGMQNWSLEKVRKSQAAHGVSVAEIIYKDGQWQVVKPSIYARRITANTSISISGPAKGHRLMKTAADPYGTTVSGTLNNCGCGQTPWGTYLTCEENFAHYFKPVANKTADQLRWSAGSADGYFRWHTYDKRFDMSLHPNEIHRFGWIVEIDPFDPTSKPVKRTALGRASHENAAITLTSDGRAVVYSGEDARFEYIYKFVSRDAVKPGGASANRTLLDYGTLYVARFNADNTGKWLALTYGKNGLTATNGFSNQGDVLIKSRQASDKLGATKMDRPEWISINAETREVFCSLTNNKYRGLSAKPAVDASNPRTNNTMGNIIRWQENGDFDSTTFTWDHFVLAGDPQLGNPDKQGNIDGSLFACPDGLWLDQNGLLWIHTNISSSAIGSGDYANLGNNALLAANTQTGKIKRFLTAPRGAEVTGGFITPDGRNLFVNIQHPGEIDGARNDPLNPTKISTWPYGKRPRSATIVVRRNDGGIIGT